MQAILHDKIQIAKAVNATVISLDEAPKGYKDFDKGAREEVRHRPARDDQGLTSAVERPRRGLPAARRRRASIGIVGRAPVRSRARLEVGQKPQIRGLGGLPLPSSPRTMS